uniref:cuticle protein 8-like n=1 Tax=Helicoverpa zea TaxID=7113 RepID=UPI001F5A8512|nr:cuticle protein 8-like [Helicoverpa zea]
MTSSTALIYLLPQLAVLSGLVISASCMLLHQPRIPFAGVQPSYYDSNPNYNFAYEVNDAHTGDIKSQHESRRGDTVLGQYSLLQPDGIRRTVDYRADDHTGFQATVNNDGRAAGHAQAVSNDIGRYPNLAVQTYNTYPAPTAHPSPAPIPVAYSRSSFSQTISHGSAALAHNPWP